MVALITAQTTPSDCSWLSDFVLSAKSKIQPVCLSLTQMVWPWLTEISSTHPSGPVNVQPVRGASAHLTTSKRMRRPSVSSSICPASYMYRLTRCSPAADCTSKGRCPGPHCRQPERGASAGIWLRQAVASTASGGGPSSVSSSRCWSRKAVVISPARTT